MACAIPGVFYYGTNLDHRLALLIYCAIFYKTIGAHVWCLKVAYVLFSTTIFSLWCWHEKAFAEIKDSILCIWTVYFLAGLSLMLIQEYLWHQSTATK